MAERLSKLVEDYVDARLRLQELSTFRFPDPRTVQFWEECAIRAKEALDKWEPPAK